MGTERTLEPKTPYPKTFHSTTHDILRTALSLVSTYFQDRNSPAIEEGMEILDEMFGAYSIEHPDKYKSLSDPSAPVGDDGLGFALYQSKPTIYRVLARAGVRAKVNDVWYPTVVYQDAETGEIHPCTVEGFNSKFETFRTSQEVARVGARTKVNDVWYPATVYQDTETGEIYTRTVEDFDSKFEGFGTYQDAARAAQKLISTPHTPQ